MKQKAKNKEQQQSQSFTWKMIINIDKPLPRFISERERKCKLQISEETDRMTGFTDITWKKCSN